MRHAGSGVLVAWSSRNESPTSGPTWSWTGHESSLDPDCERPHHRSDRRRITAGPGARGTLRPERSHFL